VIAGAFYEKGHENAGGKLPDIIAELSSQD
jgi:hypothetical protein